MAMKFKKGQRVKVKRTGLSGIISVALEIWNSEYFVELDNGKDTIVSANGLIPTN